MPHEITIDLSPKDSSHESFYKPILAKKLKIDESQIRQLKILRKSIDARRFNIRVNMAFQVFLVNESEENSGWQPNFKTVHNSQEVIVVGSGPAGLFAALRLIKLGLKPVIIERGKPVDERIKDITALDQKGVLDTESNYCFGEGGAGTFSDGKLYTRSKKRGDHYKVMEILQYHGADEAILYEAHPHIGSDKLPQIIAAIRKTILDSGGNFLFGTKVEDFVISNDKISAIITNKNEKIAGSAVILATGHSARDIFFLLDKRNIELETKPFAMGIRVEHPQQLIDEIQYQNRKSNYLPPATYNIVQQVNGRGVYSFCMCPGGQIVPAVTSPDEIVVNGMSNANRNSAFANAGLVVQILPADFERYNHYKGLAALKLQEDFEKNAFNSIGNSHSAPAQKIVDFMQNRLSSVLPPCSYLPGITASPMHEWMPQYLVHSLKAGLKEIDKKMHGFISNDAIMVGVESRTSSPVRIPRNPETWEHIRIRGLFPCGEGSGYAGGIISSAVDGDQAATRCFQYIEKGN